MITPVVGRMYRIRYKSNLQRVEREAVMVFLGNRPGDSTSWSARPAAGTQELPVEWIRNIVEVDRNTTPYLNRRVK